MWAVQLISGILTFTRPGRACPHLPPVFLQSTGTKGTAFRKTPEETGYSFSSSNAPNTYMCSISAMPQFDNKSFEELRHEDCMSGPRTKVSSGFAAAVTGSAAAGPFTGTQGVPFGSPAFGGPSQVCWSGTAAVQPHVGKMQRVMCA